MIKFNPNVELIDNEGTSQGLFLQCGQGATRFFISEDVWYSGGPSLLQSQVDEMGWTVRELAGIVLIRKANVKGWITEGDVVYSKPTLKALKRCLELLGYAPIPGTRGLEWVKS